MISILRILWSYLFCHFAPEGAVGRRRVRLKAMAEELDISERRIRQLLLLGLPHTQLEGLIWCEPETVHAWLDKFNRRGRLPDVGKRGRGRPKAPKLEPV